MKQYLICTFFLIFCSLLSYSQKGEIKGTVKDAISGETIIGATVILSDGKGTITDIDGNYSLMADSGSYTLTISFVGYEIQTAKVKVSDRPVLLNFTLQTKTLNEVEIVADVAKTRETPVAFSSMTSKQIQEELGTRDIPMVLNSTPGTYATEQGGGSGDARITIRGFDQRNVAVMVDGVPVNDMENGQVYWSNWDGLSDITRTMQVQRGLGASKLAIASVGGTINIITKGIDQKMGGSIKQEVNDYGLYKTSFGYNSGQLKWGWGITLGGSRKWGTGFADATFTDAWSYFIKIQKRFNKHLISISANGAPQRHGQRTDRLPIAVYSEKLSNSLGVNSDSVYTQMGMLSYQYYTTLAQGERGIKYNPNSGNLKRLSDVEPLFVETFNDKVNFFHKPQFNLSHFWNPGEKLNVSTVAYLSIGKGGGTGLKGGFERDTVDGLIKIQKIYDNNLISSPNFGYDSTEHPSNNYLRAANNNHLWYGFLSTWNYKINNYFSVLIGLDGRYYKGTHYQSIYDLLGGDYAIDNTDKNQPTGLGYTQFGIKRVGDKVSYYNDAIVKWGGTFAQAEYKKEKWSAFITASISETSYQRIDYFKKKDLLIGEETFPQVVGWKETFLYNGTEKLTTLKTDSILISGDTTFFGPKSNPRKSYILNAEKYTSESPEARTSTTDEKWFLGYTIKGGTNYNINEHHNVFVNLGYLNMAPRMNVVFDNNNYPFLFPQNQKVHAIEAGYGLKHPKYAANLNLYYTLWENKPPQYTPSKTDPTTGKLLSYNINGLDALHKGIELDFIYKIIKNIDFEGLVSIGDWKTISGNKVYVTNEDGDYVDTVDFSAKNVHVGDAAQIQYAASVRYEIIKNLYIKPRYTYFAKNYANFDPTTLTEEIDSKTGDVIYNNKDRESWQMPDYGLLDIYAGYDIKFLKLKFTLTAGVMNAMNIIYITDAQNNFDPITGNGFDATRATVYVGQGRRYNVALKISF